MDEFVQKYQADEPVFSHGMRSVMAMRHPMSASVAERSCLLFVSSPG
jgi:hypothetical protein